jgi:hypothetical protein
MAFLPGPEQQANLAQLVAERNILRLGPVRKVDLDEIVASSYTVLRLLRLAQTNRLALGTVDQDHQSFSMPGAGPWEEIDVRVKLDRVLQLEDFADPRTPRGRKRGASKRNG